MENNDQKTEFIDIGGGSGHIQVATALGANETNRHDLLESFFMKLSLKDKWNNSNKEGAIDYRNRFARYTCPLLNWISSPFVLINFFRMLLKKRPKKIITTQFFGLTSMCMAIKAYNLISKQKCSFELFMTDFPSEECIHYFPFFKRVSTRNKNFLKFFVPHPVVNEDQESIFWEKYCKLKMETINFIADPDLPVRASFRNFDLSRINQPEYEFRFVYQTLEEKELINRLFSENQKINQMVFRKDSLTLCFKTNKTDFIWSMMLSSFPPEKEIFSYLEQFFVYTRRTGKKIANYYFIIFCGRHETKTESLFKKISDSLKRRREGGLADNIFVVPVTFQKDDILANTFYGSTIVHTAGGGSTAFEHSVMSSKLKQLNIAQHRLIHSGCPSIEQLKNLFERGLRKGRITSMSRKLNYQWFEEMTLLARNGFQGDVAKEYFRINQDKILREGFILPEWGNVKYLLKHTNAKIVTPDNIANILMEMDIS